MSSELFRRHLFFLCFVLASVLVLWMPLRKLINFSLTHDYGSHIVLVGPASVYLIYLKRREVFSKVQTNLVTSSSLVLAGMIAWFSSHHYAPLQSNYISIEIAAIILLWMSGFVLCYGSQAFRAARFPLLFLMLLIPIPNGLLDKTILFLQSGSAAVAYWLLRMLNVPVLKEGFVLLLPALKLEVAKECSGIRSSLALLVTTLLVGQSVLRSPWRKSLLILTIVPIVILKNALRIVTISLLTIYVNPAFLHGKLHTSGGIVFYLLALLVLVPVIVVLKRGEINRNSIGHKIGSPDVNLEPGGLPIVHRQRLARP